MRLPQYRTVLRAVLLPALLALVIGCAWEYAAHALYAGGEHLTPPMYTRR